MEEALSEEMMLKLKEELKQSLDALTAQSSSLLEVSVRFKVVDEYFESVLKKIENRRDEAVSEIRVREKNVEKRVEEGTVREKRFRDWKESALGEMRRKEMDLEDWEREVEKREKRDEEIADEVDEWRESLRLKEMRFEVLRSGIFGEICTEKIGLNERKKGIEMRVEEMERENEERAMRMEDERTRLVKGIDNMRKEVDERRESLRLKEIRFEVLRSGIFGEICKEQMGLNEREKGIEMRVEEMERENEERAMRMEDERTRLAKGIDNRRKEVDRRGKKLDQRKKLIDAKVKEVEAKELSLNEDEKAFKKRAAELDMKEKEMCDMKRALNYLVDEVESERDENKALQQQVLLLSQKLESMAKSTYSSVKSTDEGNLANQLNLNVVPCTSNAGTTMDGRTLQMYINDMASNDEPWQDEILTILKNLSEPAKIVLEAMEGFYPPHLSIDEKQFDTNTVRKTCLCLLRMLKNISPSVNPVVRDEALKLALEWEDKMTVRVENPLEVTGFLELVMTYGLTKEFNGFELLNLSKIAFGETAPLKLLHDLGCTDNISPSQSTPYDTNSESMNTETSKNIGYVSNLLSNNQRLQALEYICQFDLADDFSISVIVDVHVNNLKQNSRKLLVEKEITTAAQEAAEFEKAGLKELIKCIETHKLQVRCSPASLSERIAQLEGQFSSKKRAAPSMGSNPHVSPPFKKRECMKPDANKSTSPQKNLSISEIKQLNCPKLQSAGN